MDQNVALMPPQNNVEMVVKPLEWGPLPKEPSWLEMPVDVVLLTDVLYNQGSHDVLLDTLDWLVQEQTKILLAYKERNPDERIFFEKLKQRNYQAVQVEEEDLVCEIYWIQKSSE
ncbi:hypothetical protein CLU79DRAFT_721790 [Phycomyces nitens]|nr:hypothetical protein CLU79DRAFT_721790 [Phycomyces nitens]